MSNTKYLKLGLLVLIDLVLLSVLFLSTVIVVNAESTTLYLDWNLKNDPETGGHLTLSGFPKTMEDNQTYKIEINLTLERGPDQTLESLKFSLNASAVDTITLGNCAINSTMKKSDSVTIYSHWTLRNISDKTEGTLIIESGNGRSIVTTPTEITIKLRQPNTLRLLNLPKTLNRGESFVIKGKLNFSGNIDYNVTWSKISLIYLKPNGTEIIRETSTNDIGYFTDTFVPDLEGMWRVKASWNGTEKYVASSSSVETFEVQGPIPIYLYLAIVGVSVWIVVTLIVHAFVRKKEQIYSPNEDEETYGKKIKNWLNSFVKKIFANKNR